MWIFFEDNDLYKVGFYVGEVFTHVYSENEILAAAQIVHYLNGGSEKMQGNGIDLIKSLKSE